MSKQDLRVKGQNLACLREQNLKQSLRIVVAMAIGGLAKVGVFVSVPWKKRR
jgi:hypothetical protein